ncbi:MAG: hypothetical protein ACKN9P_04450 [Phenylobacterium sp.]
MLHWSFPSTSRLEIAGSIGVDAPYVGFTAVASNRCDVPDAPGSAAPQPPEASPAPTPPPGAAGPAPGEDDAIADLKRRMEEMAAQIDRLASGR